MRTRTYLLTVFLHAIDVLIQLRVERLQLQHSAGVLLLKVRLHFDALRVLHHERAQYVRI